MCKNNLGCPDQQDCGCRCKDCNGSKSNVTAYSENQFLPQSSSVKSGYSKPSPEDYVTESLLPGNSGYGKKEITIAPSGYNKKEIVTTEPAREIIVSAPVPQKPKEDNTGLYVAGLGLLLLLGLASAAKDKD